MTTNFAYIAGTSYCGSTLLSFILNAQPGIVSVGELAWHIPSQNAGRYKCSCGLTLDTCSFWDSVSKEMARRGYVFDAQHWATGFKVSNWSLVDRIAKVSLAKGLSHLRDSIVHSVPGWRRGLQEIGRRNGALVDSIATVAHASIFVDASKTPSRIAMLRKYAGIEPYVIHLLRDSPAFVKSYIRDDPRDFSVAIAWWNRTIKQLERIKMTIPDNRWLLVRYEDLCADPDGETHRILRFLGVAGDKPVLNFRDAPHHIIGNRRMRLGTTSEIRLDLSWRDGLSRDQLSRILARTQAYRRQFGYPEMQHL